MLVCCANRDLGGGAPGLAWRPQIHLEGGEGGGCRREEPAKRWLLTSAAGNEAPSHTRSCPMGVLSTRGRKRDYPAPKEAAETPTPLRGEDLPRTPSEHEAQLGCKAASCPGACAASPAQHFPRDLSEPSSGRFALDTGNTRVLPPTHLPLPSRFFLATCESGLSPFLGTLPTPRNRCC